MAAGASSRGLATASAGVASDCGNGDGEPLGGTGVGGGPDRSAEEVPSRASCRVRHVAIEAARAAAFLRAVVERERPDSRVAQILAQVRAEQRLLELA